MTANDNSLTQRAIGAPTGSLTYPVSDLRVFLAGLERLGYSRGTLLSAAGLQQSALDDPDGRIPCELFGAVVGAAMRERPMKNLAVRIATETPIGAFPLLDYLVVTANDVRDGVKQLAHYFRLEQIPTAFDVREDRDPVEVAIMCGTNFFSLEFTLSLCVLHLRQETNQRFHPETVNFEHSPEDAAEIQTILGCPVSCNANWSGMVVSREAWQLPFRRRDAVLRSLLEEQANGILARAPLPDGVGSDVRRLLAKQVAGGDTRIESIARQMATSPRTLQRRLESVGTSYQEILDSVRRDAVEQYLMDSKLSIAEVAYLLGYSEPSALHRAFKRWNGTTPQEFRHQSRKGSKL